MRILTELTGAKREIFSFGNDLKETEGLFLAEGNFDLAGKRKRDYFYIPASNTIRLKTQAELDAEKEKARRQKKIEKVSAKIGVLIEASATYADLKAAVQAMLDETTD